MRQAVCAVTEQLFTAENVRGPVPRVAPSARKAWYNRNNNARSETKRRLARDKVNDIVIDSFGYMPMAGNARYLVNDLGMVWDALYARPKALMTCKKGYTFITVPNVSKHKRKYVHEAVLEAFSGERPLGFVTRHLNGIKSDNRLSNLEWGTRSRNGLDVKWHGKSKGIKIYPEDVRAIRKSLAEGHTKMGLARAYGVSAATVYKVAKNLTHVDVT